MYNIERGALIMAKKNFTPEELQAKAEKWGRVEDKARTRYVKNIATTRKNVYDAQAKIQGNVNKQTSLKEKRKYKKSTDAMAIANDAAANTARTQASRARTQRGKNRLNRQADNSASMAKTHRELYKNGQTKTLQIVKAEWNTPMKNVRNGKSTTYGKELVKAAALTAAYSAISTGISLSRQMG